MTTIAINIKMTAGQKTLYQSRDIRFDILKALGLFCIIIAHSSPPDIIFELRNFDVPLMVIVSGALFYSSFSNKNYSILDYLKKRIPRLIAPVWLFLSFFFCFNYICSLIAGKSYPFSNKVILSSFLLGSGIGYVWIIRVFILMAIISPLILRLYRYIKNETIFLTVLAGIYLFYELILYGVKQINIENLTLLRFMDSFHQFIIPMDLLMAYCLSLLLVINFKGNLS